MNENIPVVSERVRILAAASVLSEFTVGGLVAYSGANAETIRTVLRRDSDLFTELESAVPTGPGRPAHRYKIQDRAAIRRLLAELPANLGDRQRLQVADGQHRLDALMLAEEAVLRAASTAPEPDAELRVAKKYLARATDGPPDDLAERARSVEMFADFTQARLKHERVTEDELRAGADALARFADVAPADRVRDFFGSFVDVAMQNRKLPPLAMLLDREMDPRDTNTPLAAVEWQPHPGPHHSRVMWSQPWAEPLFKRRLLTGIVLHEGREATNAIQDRLDDVPSWAPARLVLSERDGFESQVRAAEAGALRLPASSSYDVIARTLRKAWANSHVDIGPYRAKAEPAAENVNERSHATTAYRG